MRTCTLCGETKPLGEFDPKRAKCKDCRRAYCRDYAKKNPRRGRKYPEGQILRKRQQAFKRRYGITMDERDAMFAAQGYRCAICDATESNGPGWCTDHDHSCCPQKAGSCGSCIRGVLCYRCNTLLGHARDNADTLQAAIDYLTSWRDRG